MSEKLRVMVGSDLIIANPQARVFVIRASAIPDTRITEDGDERITESGDVRALD